MRASRWLVLCFSLLLSTPGVIRAQEKAKPEPPADIAALPVTPLNVRIVLTEYDGTKKIDSLPYTLSFNTLDKSSRAFTSLRIGNRVPITGALKSGESSVTYLDIGTNIDARVSHSEEGKYVLELTFERSSLNVSGVNHEARERESGEPPPSAQPPVRQFRGNLSVSLRDGQTMEVAMATDPLTGHVLKVEATLTVLK